MPINDKDKVKCLKRGSREVTLSKKQLVLVYSSNIRTTIMKNKQIIHIICKQMLPIFFTFLQIGKQDTKTFLCAKLCNISKKQLLNCFSSSVLFISDSQTD